LREQPSEAIGEVPDEKLMTVACKELGLHERCSGRVTDEHQVDIGPCACACHQLKHSEIPGATHGQSE
jgi:hypothetical protein